MITAAIPANSSTDNNKVENTTDSIGNIYVSVSIRNREIYKNGGHEL